MSFDFSQCVSETFIRQLWYNWSVTRPVTETKTESVVTAPGSQESKRTVEPLPHQGLAESDGLMVTACEESAHLQAFFLNDCTVIWRPIYSVRSLEKRKLGAGRIVDQVSFPP